MFKESEVIWEIEHYNLNILSLSETKVKCNSMKVLDRARCVYMAEGVEEGRARDGVGINC